MEYATLEFVANCLDWIHHLKDDQRPYSRILRIDQKRLIRGMLRELTDQLLESIEEEGDHPGWKVHKSFLTALYSRRYEMAYQLLPALGVVTDSPFLGDCPMAERILPPE